jgi:hypothetical protein
MLPYTSMLLFRKCGARTTTLPERGVNTYKDDEVRFMPDLIFMDFSVGPTSQDDKSRV